MVLEALKVLIELKLSPAEGPVSDNDASKGESSAWQIRMGLVIEANTPSSNGGEVALIAGWVLMWFSAIGALVSAIGGTLEPTGKVSRPLGECGITF